MAGNFYRQSPRKSGTSTFSGVSPVRSLWASIQGDPVFMRRANGWLTVLWIVMIPVSVATGWVKSVAYVSALSLWALVAGHWSAWQAARVEVVQHQEIERQAREGPVEARVVEHLVAKTEIEPAEGGAGGETP